MADQVPKLSANKVPKGKHVAAKNFETLVKEMGYVKARQLYKQVAIQKHEAEIKTKDAQEMAARKPERLASLTKLSLTIGSPVIENELVMNLQKILTYP